MNASTETTRIPPNPASQQRVVKLWSPSASGSSETGQIRQNFHLLERRVRLERDIGHTVEEEGMEIRARRVLRCEHRLAVEQQGRRRDLEREESLAGLELLEAAAEEVEMHLRRGVTGREQTHPVHRRLQVRAEVPRQGKTLGRGRPVGRSSGHASSRGYDAADTNPTLSEPSDWNVTSATDTGRRDAGAVIVQHLTRCLRICAAYDLSNAAVSAPIESLVEAVNAASRDGGRCRPGRPRQVLPQQAVHPDGRSRIERRRLFAIFERLKIDKVAFNVVRLEVGQLRRFLQAFKRHFSGSDPSAIVRESSRT